MSKSKLLYIFLAVYFFAIFIPANLWIYFRRERVKEVPYVPNKVVVITTSPTIADTEPTVAITFDKPETYGLLPPDQKIDDSILGEFKSSLLTNKMDTVISADLLSNIISLSEGSFYFTDKTIFLCYAETTRSGTKAYEIFLDFRSMPLSAIDAFLKASNSSTFDQKKVFLSEDSIGKTVLISTDAVSEGDLKWLLLFSDNCGEFSSLKYL